MTLARASIDGMETGMYKEQLIAERTRLEGELRAVGTKNPINPTDWEARPQETGQESDPVDQADLMEGFGENAAILEDLEIRYREVLAALERIENGTYGVCTLSGEPIEEDRLAADPAAKTCKAHMNN